MPRRLTGRTSRGDGCPAHYETNRHTIVVQGWTIDRADEAYRDAQDRPTTKTMSRYHANLRMTRCRCDQRRLPHHPNTPATSRAGHRPHTSSSTR